MSDPLDNIWQNPRDMPPRTPQENGDEIVRLRVQMGELRKDVQGLGGKVDHLAVAVEKLTDRIAPVEQHVSAEMERERLVEEGWTPPNEALPTVQPSAPVVPADMRPRIWESDDGRTVIKWTLAAMVLCALALAGGLSWADIRGVAGAWVGAPAIETSGGNDDAAMLIDTAPGQVPPKPEPTL